MASTPGRLSWLRNAGQAPQPAGQPPSGVRYAYLGDHRALVQLHNGARLFIDTRDLSIAPSLIAHGKWEWWVETALSRLVRPGQVAVDVGAHFGYYTVALAQAVGEQGKVFAFEANPHLVELLTAGVITNGLTDIVTVINAAIIDHEEIVSFRVDPRFSGGGHLAHPIDTAALDSYTIQATTLSAALAGVDRIDVLRMDIEGCEPLALRGAEALIRNSPELTIVSEWDVGMMSDRGDVSEMVHWLAAMDFAFWEIKTEDATLRPCTAEELPALPHCDVVMCRRDPRD
jgi:FkbM family methyltransferase